MKRVDEARESVTAKPVQIGSADEKPHTCGAWSRRTGAPCRRSPVLGKSRCRQHGGASTGPKTEEGRMRAAAAHWRHGKRSKAFAAERKTRTAVRRGLSRAFQDNEAAVGRLARAGRSEMRRRMTAMSRVAE
ncbi:MAG: hypothetical protein FJX42_08060 [Alphaproteobacteria bacterium]|nr:hypothetical protein [Alphaproteobacteria bacterium]